MNGYLEIEYSALLTQKQFNTCLRDLKPSLSFTQDNHYYQYNDKSIRIAARIRELNAQKILTFKMDHPTGRMEYNFNLTDQEDPFNRVDVLNFLNSKNLKAGFTFIGTLTTHRSLIQEGYCEICLDENHYLGHCDYELEVESIDDPTRTKQRFTDLCVLFSIEQENYESKYARFLKQKRL